MPEMSYVEIDPIIAAWVERHNFTLVDHYEGNTEQEFRAVYLSSPLGECCQIWIDVPNSGVVDLHVGDIETKQDEELRQDWSVSVSELENALENAVEFVQKWFRRSNSTGQK